MGWLYIDRCIIESSYTRPGYVRTNKNTTLQRSHRLTYWNVLCVKGFNYNMIPHICPFSYIQCMHASIIGHTLKHSCSEHVFTHHPWNVSWGVQLLCPKYFTINLKIRIMQITSPPTVPDWYGH